jgi:hypothetical protein
MNTVEYLILKYALEFPESFYNILLDYKVSYSEVADYANKLFQNGDILASIVNEKEEDLDYSTAVKAIYPEQYVRSLISTDNYNQESVTSVLKVGKPVVLTPSQIEANLSGELGAVYYLTPKGGSRWESVANPDWSHYISMLSGLNESVGTWNTELISSDQQFLEKFFTVDEHVSTVVHIDGTEVWDVLKPWQATYWKILPLGYRVRYESREIQICIDSDTPIKWLEANDTANEWYWDFRKWYTDSINLSKLIRNPYLE